MSIPISSDIRANVSLKPYNTFHIDVFADYVVKISHAQHLSEVISSEIFHSRPHYILGGGSNVLFPEDYHGLIIKNSIPGISILSEDTNEVVVCAGAGVIWDHLVQYCLERDWGGIENLSMIPGLVGAAPIQNIGAYGVELKETFVSLEAIHLESGRMASFDREMCRFEYRNSIFKNSHKGQYLITSVTLRLQKNPELRLDYGNLREVLTDEGIDRPSIRDVSSAVRNIRTSKLPDPAQIGNAGSFFKNPVISKSRFDTLKENHPGIPGYSVEPDPGNTTGHHPPSDRNHLVKIPAAWLIEQCGFKGMRDGDAGVHERHALILVNYGNAGGKQLLGIANAIRDEVAERFGIVLEPEVNIVHSTEP